MRGKADLRGGVGSAARGERGGFGPPPSSLSYQGDFLSSSLPFPLPGRRRGGIVSGGARMFKGTTSVNKDDHKGGGDGGDGDNIGGGDDRRDNIRDNSRDDGGDDCLGLGGNHWGD